MRYSLFYAIVAMCLVSACRSDNATAQTNKEVSTIEKDLVEINLNEEPDSLTYCLTKDNVGAGGYDLVNYFNKNTAELGLSNIRTTYAGATYQFLTNQNKLEFESNPNNYLPQYGGWCSMTLAMGNATVPKYDNFKVINGKLYLFERTLSVNGQTLWLQDTVGNNILASTNYKKYIDTGEIE